jgi:hypothetical protein
MLQKCIFPDATFYETKCSEDFYNKCSRTTYLQSMFLGSKMFSRFLQQEHVSIEQNLQDIFTTNA